MPEIRDGLLVPPEERSATDLARQRKTFSSGANWFYWIAGLSVVNSLASFYQGGVSFVVGLGITQVIDAIAFAVAQEVSAGADAIRIGALLVSMVFAGLFAGFGWLANRGLGWAFLVGMVLYALDGLLFLLVADWISIAFHVFALVCMGKGYQALRSLRRVVPLREDRLPKGNA
jgi:hypothetical protein